MRHPRAGGLLPARRRSQPVDGDVRRVARGLRAVALHRSGQKRRHRRGLRVAARERSKRSLLSESGLRRTTGVSQFASGLVIGFLIGAGAAATGTYFYLTTK